MVTLTMSPVTAHQGFLKTSVPRLETQPPQEERLAERKEARPGPAAGRHRRPVLPPAVPLTSHLLHLQHSDERGEHLGLGLFHELLVCLQHALQDLCQGRKDLIPRT